MCQGLGLSGLRALGLGVGFGVYGFGFRMRVKVKGLQFRVLSFKMQGVRFTV